MFQPKNDGYEQQIRDSFARQTVMDTFGASLTRVSPGEVHIELPFRKTLTQQHGFTHAGVIATILDSACGYAAYTLMPADAAVLSIEYKINMMAPAKGEALVARGHVIRAGRTITVCRGSAFSLEDGREKHVAEMTATMMTVLDREGLAG